MPTVLPATNSTLLEPYGIPQAPSAREWVKFRGVFNQAPHLLLITEAFDDTPPRQCNHYSQPRPMDDG